MMEYKVDIAGVEYGMNDIFSATITQPLFEKLSVGNACSAELKIQFIPKGTIPRMAQITPYARKTSADEWKRLGVFYTDTRTMTGGLMEITAYDSMLRAEQVWEPDQSLEFPMTMPDAVTEIARLMDVSVDSRTVLNDSYSVDYPANDYTLRDVLRYIAAAHGGNWSITEDGELRLVPLFGTTKTYDVGNRVSNLECYSPVGPITGVCVLVDDEHEFTSGSSDGYIMEIECPYGTESMANDLLENLGGKTYYGYHADDAEIDPFAEMGDLISVGNIISILAYRSVLFGPGHMSEIAAPGENDIDHEYPYVSQDRKKIQRKIVSVTSEIRKTLDSIVLRVTDASGVTSEVKLTEAGKIDLTGYATFKGLLEGTTIIDGGCIKAGTKIESPVIVGGEIYAGTPENMLGYLKMVNDGLEVYNKNDLLKFRIGYTSSDFDYPYIQLGSGDGGGANSRGIVKKFVDGLWIGNGIAIDAGGYFSPQAGYNGIFVKFTDGKTYVVNGSNMMNVYTGDAIARFG